MSELEAAQLIEHFLEGTLLYPKEWNDFVDTLQKDTEVEAYRERCHKLDSLVNRPGEPNEDAVSALRTIVHELRGT